MWQYMSYNQTIGKINGSQVSQFLIHFKTYIDIQTLQLNLNKIEGQFV